jgi:hypothetical protein
MRQPPISNGRDRSASSGSPSAFMEVEELMA